MQSKLTVGELLTLEQEFIGVKDNRTGATITKGLLSQKLDGDVKYDLLELYYIT